MHEMIKPVRVLLRKGPQTAEVGEKRTDDIKKEEKQPEEIRNEEKQTEAIRDEEKKSALRLKNDTRGKNENSYCKNRDNKPCRDVYNDNVNIYNKTRNMKNGYYHTNNYKERNRNGNYYSVKVKNNYNNYPYNYLNNENIRNKKRIVGTRTYHENKEFQKGSNVEEQQKVPIINKNKESVEVPHDNNVNPLVGISCKTTEEEIGEKNITMTEEKGDCVSSKAKAKINNKEKKVIVRLLPPDLTEEQFFSSFPDDLKDKLSNYYFVNGKFSKYPSGEITYSRVYLTFREETNATDFIGEYHGKCFFDGHGLKYRAVVSFAPYQSFITKNKIDKRNNTLETDAYFKKICEEMNKPKQAPKDSVDYNELINVKNENGIIISPLVLELRNKMKNTKLEDLGLN